MKLELPGWEVAPKAMWRLFHTCKELLRPITYEKTSLEREDNIQSNIIWSFSNHIKYYGLGISKVEFSRKGLVDDEDPSI